jgi:hypothetical protein
VRFPTAAAVAVPAGVSAAESRYPVIVWAMGAGPLHSSLPIITAWML